MSTKHKRCPNEIEEGGVLQGLSSKPHSTTTGTVGLVGAHKLLYMEGSLLQCADFICKVKMDDFCFFFLNCLTMASIGRWCLVAIFCVSVEGPKIVENAEDRWNEGLLLCCISSREGKTCIEGGTEKSVMNHGHALASLQCCLFVFSCDRMLSFCFFLRQNDLIREDIEAHWPSNAILFPINLLAESSRGLSIGCVD